MYGLIGKLIATPGNRDAMAAILVEGASAMPGCLSYIVSHDAADENAIWVTEVWQDRAAHRESLNLPSVAAAIAKARPIIAGFGERFETEPVGGHGLQAQATIIDNQMLWRQFGVAIDMLGGTLRDCPDELWEKRLWEDQPDQWVAAGFSAYWYLCYHALFWLDLYLTGAEEGFAPPAPFDLVEMESGEVLPRTYTREELLRYLDHCRRRCQETIEAMSHEQACRLCRFPWGELPFAELQLYSLRHVQEHAAQLRMFLGQQAGTSARLAPR